MVVGLEIKMRLTVRITSVLVILLQVGLFVDTVNSQEDTKVPSSYTGISSLEKNGLLQIVNQILSPGYARSYIASRLQRITMQPSDKTSLYHKSLTLTKSQPMLGSGSVPVIPEGTPTPKWIPGELIASQLTKRQLRLINESVFGPLKSATMFPAVMSTILVFNKPYNPERLADVLKFNFGVEAEPNGVILESKV